MRSDCPLNYGLEIFGDKWTLLVIRDLIFFNKQYYNEFLSSDEGISTNILADRLNLLEKGKFISKRKDKEHKQKIIYRLTEKGIDLFPIIAEIGLWSDKYATGIPQKKIDMILGKIKKDRDKGMKEMKKKLYEEHVR